MSRDNQTWVIELKAGRESALTDLRTVLLHNLRKALAARPRADESFLEDAVQDAVLRVIDRLDQFAGGSQFVTWATSIAIRVALGELRRSRWKDVSLSELTADSQFMSTCVTEPADSPLARQAILESLQHCIAHDLTDRQRMALCAELKGMPQDEIAKQLGSNRNAVYKLTHDARKNLKKGLEAAGYTAEDVATTVS
ncbi:sigma-70 family RNA polymerase sigma factor [Stieleria sp. ICT_E10.1]|uniref:RNA polymerase sigma factor n=1 Tax=Stieleria sedimenti TaxID=2976331 RepID=UPI00217F8F34|nr:sigma-70 family RNA polymerase sigma factor [Stieleria sedimenti]MCS7468617.1 sigma-70 family RNA polymerase sigma factor [Stieleria sedimenti]